MADGRKRDAPVQSTSFGPPRRRFRSSPGNPNDILRKAKVAAALVLVVSTVTAAVVHCCTPVARQAVYEPRRLDWDEHTEDLERRGLFRRMYRMDQHTFDKLADLMTPILERNDYFARKRTASGAVPVKLWLAVALRMLAGTSYIDVAVVFGVSKETVYNVLWQVVDAINNTPEVGPFFFPQSVDECTRQARLWERRSTGGIFRGVVAAVDGLFIKTLAPTAVNTPNVLSYFSGSKCGYGMNVQATCDSNFRFCSMSCISPGATNDWAAWTRSDLSKSVERLPPGFCVLGDAAYPLSDNLLIPYPGKDLSPDRDAFNFHLSQLRIRIEQAFGIVVGQWGILWKPLRVQFAGRTDLVTAIFRLHNFLRDEQVPPILHSEEDAESGSGRPPVSARNTLPAEFSTPAPGVSRLTRSGDVPTRMAITMILDDRRQYRPEYNLQRQQAQNQAESASR